MNLLQRTRLTSTALLRSGHRTRANLVLATLFLVIAGLVVTGPAAHAVAQNPPVQDVIIVVDNSESMRGVGAGAKDIWEPKVLPAIAAIIDRLTDGTNVAIVPFDEGPRLDLTYPEPLDGGNLNPVIMDLAERERIKARLRGLPVDGQVTYICESVTYALDQLARWLGDSENHSTSLFLYTDGLDNGPTCGEKGIDGIIELLKLRRGDFPFLYVVYNDLGENVSPEGCKQLEDIGARCSRGPELPPSVSLDTQQLDFGELPIGGESAQELTFSSSIEDVWDRDIPIAIRVESATSGLVVESDSPTLKRSVGVIVMFRGAPPSGMQRAQLVVEVPGQEALIVPDNTVDIVFTVQPPPPAPSPTQPPSRETPEPTPTTEDGEDGDGVCSEPLPCIIIAALAGLVAVLVSYSSFFVPRFPSRAVLKIDDIEFPLKRSARRTFFRAQRIVLGGSPPFDLGLDESVAELRAARKGDGAMVDPLGREDVTYDGQPLDQPRPVYYGGTISAIGRRVQYDRMEPEILVPLDESEY